MTAGDLGTTAELVEERLSKVLELCSEWGALTLLDEADVFLEARTSAELQRNSVVCVMLRLLECAGPRSYCFSMLQVLDGVREGVSGCEGVSRRVSGVSREF